MISAVVLTHNSALTLSKTLKSLAFVDQIIVVDDESNDTTVSIAKSHKAVVVSHPLHDDFAEQRNIGLLQAKGDWVLYVDSDEVVSPALASEIVEVSRATSDVKGYMVKREDMMWGKVLRHGETENVKLLRLARRDAGTWIRPVHEEWKVHGLLGNLSYPLLHTPHPNVSKFLESVGRYSTINAHYLYKQKTNVSVWHIIAYPVAKFFINYIVRMGFLDGTPGIVLALMMSFHSFLVRSKLWLLTHHSKS